MDTLDDSDNNAKISDSAYSNSCSNSQSRRSQSSKSTHSGSSGSSGYGGKPSTSGSSNKLEQPSKKDKDAKKRKLSQTEGKIVEEPLVAECIPHCEVPKEEMHHVVEPTTPPSPLALPEKAVENMDILSSELTSQKHEMPIATMQAVIPVGLESSCLVENEDADGFSCAISMHDGVVTYTTENVTTNLGFPKDIWIGRSFIDFVHPKDRSTFASQITNGLAMPKIANETQNKVESPVLENCTMACRIRTYRSLNISFGVKDRTVAFMPFLLKFFFKDVTEDDVKIVYLIIQASPIYSGYKTPNENKENPTPFIIRHSAAGILEYIDVDSVPYLGYLPQDLHDKNALMMYHPDDLPYLKMMYELIVKKGNVPKCLPYRMLAQNGDYVKLETEWSSFTNPWSMRLEFVIGKHYIIEGPATPDVFLTPPPPKLAKTTEEIIKTELADSHRECILMIMKDVISKPTKKTKQQTNMRHSLALIMDSLLEDPPKPAEELIVETHEPDLNSHERDLVMLGGISPHHDNDSKSSTDTPLNYNQLNYNENLQRFFDSHDNYCLDDKNRNYANGEEAVKSPIGMMSSLAQNSSDSNDLSSSASSTAVMCNSLSPPANPVEFYPLRLTESLLTKHNNHMEKELAKSHRGTKTANKWDRAFNTKQKKKEHLARCNAKFKPTLSHPETHQQNGVKRPFVPMESGKVNKQKSGNSRIKRSVPRSAAEKSHFAPTNTGTHRAWQDASSTAQSNAANSYPKDMQQHLPLHAHLAGGIPMYYTPNADPGALYRGGYLGTPQAPGEVPPPPGYQATNMPPPMHPPMSQYPNAPVPWMYPHVYGAPYMYHQMPYNIQQQASMDQPMAYNPSLNTLGLADGNYIQSIEPVPESAKPEKREKTSDRSGCSGQISDETMDRTDGESSYSSFYSSFLRTESSSAEDSSDLNRPRSKINEKKETSPALYNYEPHEARMEARRTMDPPWMEQVYVNPDLIYKYKVPLKSKEETLQADLEKLRSLQQPALVNEQLGQLYLDLHLQGVASRLTLEEGITSSSSSGEESSFSAPTARVPRRKPQYSRLNMIYEEDAPLPPPTEFSDNVCSEINK